METYDGYGAEITIDGDALVLTRNGFAAKQVGDTGTWRIPLAAVAGVNFKDAGRLVNGWLQLVLGAEPAGKAGDPNDPRTVMFRHKHRAEFARLRDVLLGVVETNRAQGIDPATVAYDPPPLGRVAKAEQRQAKAEADLAEARAASDAASAELKKNVRQLKDEARGALTGPPGERVRAREREKFLAKAAELGITRPDILAAGGDMLSHVGADREVANLESYLGPGERVRKMAGGRLSERRGIVVLTDTRVLFVFQGVMGSEVEDLPLTAITSVKTKSGALLGELEVYASGNAMEIEAINKDDLKEFEEALRADLARLKAAPPTASPAGPAPAGRVDVLDQLAKLAELRDAGVVTAEEFEAKKAELLGRL